MRRAVVLNAILIVASTILTVLIVELVVRAMDGIPLTSTRNFILQRVNVVGNVNHIAEYDPVTGWRMPAGYRSDSFNTGELGFRFTSGNPPNLESPDILAVGDSLTLGSDVFDAESWPAHVQSLTGRQVLNGGVGGYGLDQTVLRAEQLLEAVQPKLLLVGIFDNDIDRVGYKVYGGGPKPYFTIHDGELEAHNNPVPTEVPAPSSAWFSQGVLGHFHLYDKFLRAFAPGEWLDARGARAQPVENDELEVSCLLLNRLKSKTDAQGVRIIAVFQYSGPSLENDTEPRIAAKVVRGCAMNAGIQTVDTFSTLKSVSRAGVDNLKELFVMFDGGRTYGHMSSAGNLQVAKMVFDAIRNPEQNPLRDMRENLAPIGGKTPVGDGMNVLGDTEKIEDGGIAGLANVELSIAAESDVGKVYRMSASGEPTEHYLSTGLKLSRPGIHILTADIRRDSSRNIRLQLLDKETAGVIVDLDLVHEEWTVNHRTDAYVSTALREIDDDWIQMQVAADLSNEQVYAILQLVSDDQRTNFAAAGETAYFRNFRVERITD